MFKTILVNTFSTELNSQCLTANFVTTKPLNGLIISLGFFFLYLIAINVAKISQHLQALIRHFLSIIHGLYSQRTYSLV